MRKLLSKDHRFNHIGLPAEVRNLIYRMSFDDQPDIVVASCKFPEPPLLFVCKQVRYEAGYILYSERKCITLADFNLGPEITFRRKYRSILKEFGVQLKRTIQLGCPHNWQNFLVGVRRVHKGFFKPPVGWQKPVPGGPVDMVDILFDTLLQAVELEHLPWSQVKSILESRRQALIAVDRRWT